MPIDPGIIAAQIVAPDTRGKLALLLGAGCSKSAGVPLAGEILMDAKREIYLAGVGENPPDDACVEEWLRANRMLQDPSRAYGEALAMLRPTPRGRRLWLEKYFKERRPSPAHEALGQLVRSGALPTLYTTNFDDLPERAIRRPEIDLRVVASEDAAGQTEFPSATPTIYKLHGDFLFDSIANTDAEVTRLPQRQQEKLEFALALGGLVVVGYGGGDESIMSVLEAVDDVPLGLYWLHIGDEPPARVRELVETRQWAESAQIESFDEWIAATVKRELAISERPPPAQSRTPADFVAHGNLRQVCDQIRELILGNGDQVVVISGLPGVGKTALARIVADEVATAGHFQRRLDLSADNRPFGVDDLLDRLARGLPDQYAPPSGEDTAQAFLETLAGQPTLIVLDNLDTLDDDVIELLRDLPPGTKAIATVRDTGRLRGLDVPFTEIEHPGLDEGEMRELAERLAARSPALRGRLDALPDGELNNALPQLQGWPQALKLLLARLEDPVGPTDLAGLLEGPGLYDRLLSAAMEALPKEAQRVLQAAAAFPSTFTVTGAANVARLSKSRAEDALRVLVSRQLVTEAGNGSFAFAHPLISVYARRPRPSSEKAKKRAQAYLEQMIDRYGGQPLPGWENFNALDAEFENVRALIDHGIRIGDLAQVTSLVSRLFSYIVERGHWLYTESLCQRVLEGDPAPTWAAEWWVWRSWIALYLRHDANGSASYAEIALDTGTRRRATRFQAHRRAVAAYAELSAWKEVETHRAAAEQLARTYRRDSEESIDLLNTIGTALRRQGVEQEDPRLLEEARFNFLEAESRNRRRNLPNTRELTVSSLGLAQVLQALGRSVEALSLAQQAGAEAWRLRWLRGIVEANELVAELADSADEKDLADSAQNVARKTRDLLEGAR